MHFPTERTAHTTCFDGPVVDHWLGRKIAQTENASVMQDDPNLHSSVLYHMSYVPPPNKRERRERRRERRRVKEKKRSGEQENKRAKE